LRDKTYAGERARVTARERGFPEEGREIMPTSVGDEEIKLQRGKNHRYDDTKITSNKAARRVVAEAFGRGRNSGRNLVAGERDRRRDEARDVREQGGKELDVRVRDVGVLPPREDDEPGRNGE
jgi:hypothetical protein